MPTLDTCLTLFYNCSDPRKAKAFHIEHEAAVNMFYEYWTLHRYWFKKDEAPHRAKIEAFLMAGEGRILGLPVVLAGDKRGVWLELEVE